ncbi:MAG: DinB family protein, partial [Schleiferiaceae bacterium]
MNLEALKYPVGAFKLQTTYTEADLDEWMATLSDLPQQLQNAVDAMSDEHLQAPYRPDGWTRTQVIHHLADSHMNCFVRCKLAL